MSEPNVPAGLAERFPEITFPLSPELLSRLPRSSAYRYQVEEGHVRLVPQPETALALLPLAESKKVQPQSGIELVPLQDSDWPALISVFAEAFSAELPWSVLSADDGQRLAADMLVRARTGADGPVVRSASWIAREARSGQIVGGVLITLTPNGQLDDFTAPAWQAQAPADPMSQCWGRPHLTWIFVTPSWTRRGLGSALLSHACRELSNLGYTELSSAFLTCNMGTVLWHWSQGFRLVVSGCHELRTDAP